MRQLKFFINLAETENMTKSSQLIHVSQPSISLSLSKLEEELGVRLFDRVNNKLTLNENGIIYYHSVKAALNMLDNGKLALSSLKSNKHYNGEMTIIGFSTLTPIIHYVCTFLVKNPSVTIHMKSSTGSLLQYTCSDADFVFCSRKNHKEIAGYESFPISNQEYVLAVGEGHWLSRETKANLHLLKNENWIFISIIKPKLEPSYYHCRALGFIPNVRAITNNVYIKLNLIANGAGIGIVPKCDAEAYAGFNNIHFLAFDPPFINYESYNLCWDSTRVLGEIQTAFLSHIKNEVLH